MDDLTSTTERLVGEQRSSRVRKRRWPARLALLAIVLVAALGATGYWYATKDLVSTDDAFTDGDAVAISSQVSGIVTALNVTDNQRVKAGDVLLRIDPRPFAAARDQAAASLSVDQAELANARLKLDAARTDYPARLAQAQAQLASAKAMQAKAEADYRRQMAMPKQATTQEAVDAAAAARLAAQAQFARADAAVRQASTVEDSINEAAAEVQELEAKVGVAKAALAQAALNLDWTAVTAPQDGWVTRRNVQKGAYVQPGQSLLALVTPDVWVTANFKETDLGRIHPGQKVEISADAYPGLHLTGHVDSIQLGSGSRFTAFPPENATGNFVKIVQRVPVKIIIDKGMDPAHPLPLGVSVEPTIRTDQ